MILPKYYLNPIILAFITKFIAIYVVYIAKNAFLVYTTSINRTTNQKLLGSVKFGMKN